MDAWRTDVGELMTERARVTLARHDLDLDCTVTGTGRPLLFLHGIGGGAADWDWNVEFFAERGFQTFAPDLPGHGRSDPPPKCWDPGNGVALIADLLDGLRLESATLVGHSAGGLLAAQTALGRPERVDSLVLAAPAGLQRRVGLTLRLLTVPVLGGLLLRPSKRAARAAMAGMFEDLDSVPPDFVRNWIERRRDPGQRRSFFRLLRSGVGLTGVRRDLVYRPRLSESELPTLIVWGAEDRVVLAPDDLDDLAGENALVQVLKLSPCGHWPQVEQADRFNSSVADFLGAVDRSKSG